ncbi:MAG: hypothetical protein E5W59_10855 [Mesorhizobium sp.]|nr:MAG: hypothetical protein E5W59_10855 [Mesorhizobium sp.]
MPGRTLCEIGNERKSESAREAPPGPYLKAAQSAEGSREVHRDDDDEIYIGANDHVAGQASGQKLHDAFGKVGERKAEQIQPIGKTHRIRSKNMRPVEK